MRFLSVIALSVAGVLTSLPAFAFDAFQIQSIQFSGLDRVDRASIMDDVFLKPGDQLTLENSNQLIRRLYASGYFDNVQLFNHHGTLVIQVEERPAIAKVTIDGNKEIKTEMLQDVLRQSGLTVGNLFDPSVLRQVTQSLQQAYYEQGKYAVQVTPEIKQLPRDRVDIDIHISEGLYATIRRITIVGNTAFSERTLLQQLTLSTPGIFSFFTHDDRYARDKLDKSTEELSNYYMDRGYINFRVTSSQVDLAIDKKQIFITINIAEGSQYTFSGYTLKGDTIVPASEMQNLIHIRSGDVFSKQVVLDAVQSMTDVLGDKGYAFASINPVPTIDEKNKTVSITFYVNPNKKQYIRKINFNGNSVANDKVLRQRMLLQEQSLYNRDAVDQSKIRLQRQPYFQSVDDHLSPVAGTDDMVDLDYDVKEMNANQVRASIGYSQLNKVILGGSLDMPDFFGTGNLFNTSVQLSRPFQSLNFTYTEPYFTPDAIQQSINVYLTHVDNQDRDIADYTTNSVGGTLSYAIPLNADDYFNLGGGYDFTNLQQPSGYTSYVVKNFLQDNPGGNYNSLIVVTGLSRNTTNNAYFPTQGVNASATLKASVPGSDLTWYKILLDAKWYHALWKRGYSVEVDGDLDYGGGYGKTKSLPFFNNFFGGGWGSVRGFDPGSLGPRDSTQCNNTDPTVCPQDVEEGQAIGGNLLIDANFNFYFPVPFITYSDTYRMGVFADMGNVYETPSLAGEWNQGSMPTFPSLSNLRYSVGVSFEWQMPMIGLIGLSLAKPLNTRADDDSTWFNFTIGNTF